MAQRLKDGLLDASPRCTACNRPSSGVVRKRKSKPGKGKSGIYWESACYDHLRAVAYTDPQHVKVHSPNGYVPWSVDLEEMVEA